MRKPFALTVALTMIASAALAAPSRRKAAQDGELDPVVARSTAAPAGPFAPAAQKESPAVRSSIAGVRKRLGSGLAFDSKAGAGDDSGVSAAWVDRMIAKDAKTPAPLQRLRDVVQNVGFTQAALNRDVIAAHNDHYTLVLPSGQIQNQQSSGRCWIFAGVNMLRSQLISEGKVPPDFEFSQAYPYFFYMLEQSNRQLDEAARLLRRQKGGAALSSEKLREKITPRVGDGGWFEYFKFLVGKYGLVPKSAMPEGASSTNTGALDNELDVYLGSAIGEMMSAMQRPGRTATPEELARIKQRAMSRIWSILVTHLGTPPAKFDYRQDEVVKKSTEPVMGRSLNGLKAEVPQIARSKADIVRYTPQGFASAIGFDPNEYAVVSNFPRKEQGKLYEMRRDPSIEGVPARFLNVGGKRLKALVTKSVKGGDAVWFAGDVLKDVDYKTGIMHPNIYERQAVYGFSSSAGGLSRSRQTWMELNVPDHAMTITGLDQPDPRGPVVKFRVENSWGDTTGSKGIYHMYAKWFDQNVFEAVVRTSYLNAAEKKAWAGKPKLIRGKYMF